MKITNRPCIIDLIKRIVFVLGSIALSYFGILGFSIVSPPSHESDLLDGITFGNSISTSDRAYLQTSLEFLRLNLPEWYKYVVEAKPLVFSVDEELAQRGMISDAKCCYTRGMGFITFGVHLEHWPVPDAVRIQGVQPYQFQILSTLIHEVTHIRDQREGRVGKNTDYKTCITAEASAYGKEVEFARALTQVQFGGEGAARENYRLVTEKQLEIALDNYEGVSWKIACILSHTDSEGQ